MGLELSSTPLVSLFSLSNFLTSYSDETFFLLGIRVKPYLTQIVSTILWRLNNKSAKVRQQAADLTTRLAVVIKQCGEDQLLSKLGLVLFEQLGEEYPDTLGSIIAAEGAIANVVGMTQMNPPVKDLCEFNQHLLCAYNLVY